jgi:putative membrane protein
MGALALRVLIAIARVLPDGASAHAPDSDERAATAALALHWSFEPWIVACLMASLASYLIGLRRLWRHAGHGRGIGAARAAAFGIGWSTLALALLSPLDALGAQLFSAHMLQHELLMVVAAPLMVLGRPLALWAWALPAPARRGVGALFHHPAWRRPWRLLSAPLSAWTWHAAALWLWHVPAWFDAALHHSWAHTLQHLSFLFSALLFWWTALGPVRRDTAGVALASVFTTMLHTGALGALLALASFPWYPDYVSRSAALGRDALEDQQLGGLLMWIPASLAYLAVGLALAARWLDSPRRQPT